jgi:hypothetical protein
MLKNTKMVSESRLASRRLQDKDYTFFMEQTELSRPEIDKIFKIFDEKGYKRYTISC